MEAFSEIKRGGQQFEEATAIRGPYKIKGEAARSKAIALRIVGRTLSHFVLQPLGRTLDGESPPTYSPLAFAKRAFHDSYPHAPHDFPERLARALVAAESSPSRELSEGSQSILRQLARNLNPADLDLVRVALKKLDAIQPMMDTLERGIPGAVIFHP